MILDKGICTVYRMEDISEPGGMPKEEPVKFHESWFGELDFGTNRSTRHSTGRMWAWPRGYASIRTGRLPTCTR